MAKKVTVESHVKAIENANVFLLKGKKPVILEALEMEDETVTVSFKSLNKDNKVMPKAKEVTLKSIFEITPIKGKLESFASISEAAVARAMKAYASSMNGSANGKKKAGSPVREAKKLFTELNKLTKAMGKTESKAEIKSLKAAQRKTLKAINKAGYEVESTEKDWSLIDPNAKKKDRVIVTRKLVKAKASKKGKEKAAKVKAEKVVALLKKEKKVVTAKVIKDTKTGKKVEFKLDGEKVQRAVKADFIFGDRAEAKEALKELKGGKKKKASKKAEPKKTAKAKDKKAAKKTAKKEKAAPAAKVFAVLKKEGKVVRAKVLKTLKSGSIKAEYKVDGEKTSGTFKKGFTFESRPEAREALKALKGGKKKAGSKKKAPARQKAA